MNHFFRRLFSSDAPAADGFTQEQREAVLDLLNFCMGADAELLPAEAEAIAAELKAFNWDPSVDLDAFAAGSRTRALAAIEQPDARTRFLDSIVSRLSTTEAMSLALDLCPQVFMADGEFAPQERAVFQEIKRAFGWPD